MRYRRLGRTGLQVSEIGLGCLEFGDRVPEGGGVRVVHAALDAGVNLFDTAFGYARGHSEETLGKALRGRRHQAVIATKARGPGPGGLSRRFLMKAIDTSLRRLQTDYIDLYQTHFPDPDTPIEETLSAFEDLRLAGKVRFYGSSNYPAWSLCDAQWRARARGFAGFASAQVKYNLLSRDIEQELLPLCVQEGLGVIAYNPLAGSFLAGLYRRDSEPPEGTRFAWSGLTDLRAIYRARYWTERNFAALDRLRDLWKAGPHTLAQHALAWVLGNSRVSCVLVGCATTAELEENLAAAGVIHTPEELAACDDLWSAVWPVQPYYVL